MPMIMKIEKLAAIPISRMVGFASSALYARYPKVVKIAKDKISSVTKK